MAPLGHGLRWLRRGLITLAALLFCYLAAALLGAVLSGAKSDPTGPPEVTIGLVAGPIHNDFLLPLTPATRHQFEFLARGNLAVDHPGAEWLLIGWGAKDFYMTVGSYSDVTLRATVKGIFGDTAVMRADVLGALPDAAPVRWIQLSQTQFDTLRIAIKQSFATDKLLLRPMSATAPGAFFAAKGNFNLVQTCNQWVSQMLRRAGLEFGAWTPIPLSIQLSLWWFHGA